MCDMRSTPHMCDMRSTEAHLMCDMRSTPQVYSRALLACMCVLNELCLRA